MGKGKWSYVALRVLSTEDGEPAGFVKDKDGFTSIEAARKWIDREAPDGTYIAARLDEPREIVTEEVKARKVYVGDAGNE